MIDQQFIDDTLRRGSGFVGGRVRIYKAYGDGRLTDAFLAKEYGTGGWSPANDAAWGTPGGSGCDFSPSGLSIRRGDETVKFKWSEVSTRIRALIETGEYLTEKERQEVAPDSFTLIDLILKGA